MGGRIDEKGIPSPAGTDWKKEEPNSEDKDDSGDCFEGFFQKSKNTYQEFPSWKSGWSVGLVKGFKAK